MDKSLLLSATFITRSGNISFIITSVTFPKNTR